MKTILSNLLLLIAFSASAFDDIQRYPDPDNRPDGFMVKNEAGAELFLYIYGLDRHGRVDAVRVKDQRRLLFPLEALDEDSQTLIRQSDELIKYGQRRMERFAETFIPPGVTGMVKYKVNTYSGVESGKRPYDVEMDDSVYRRAEQMTMSVPMTSERFAELVEWSENEAAEQETKDNGTWGRRAVKARTTAEWLRIEYRDYIQRYYLLWCELENDRIGSQYWGLVSTKNNKIWRTLDDYLKDL